MGPWTLAQRRPAGAVFAHQPLVVVEEIGDCSTGVGGGQPAERIVSDVERSPLSSSCMNEPVLDIIGENALSVVDEVLVRIVAAVRRERLIPVAAVIGEVRQLRTIGVDIVVIGLGDANHLRGRIVERRLDERISSPPD